MTGGVAPRLGVKGLSPDFVIEDCEVGVACLMRG